MDELLRRKLSTTGAELLSIRGPKNPVVTTESAYTCKIKALTDLRHLSIRFGFHQKPCEYAYHILRHQPGNEHKEYAKVVLREPVTRSGIDLPLKQSSRKIIQANHFIEWQDRNIKKDQTITYTIIIQFEEQAPEPIKSCYEQMFEPLIEISSQRNFFGSVEIIPAEVMKINTLPVFPTRLGNNNTNCDSYHGIRNEFGAVFLGKIRQVSFRAETLGYFLNAMYNADPDQFSKRLAEATNKVTDSWISDMKRIGLASDISPERWAHYDSWAGLGKIYCYKSDPDKYSIDITDPFTQDWSLPEEIQELFWHGYIKGIIESTTMRTVSKITIKGSTNGWNAIISIAKGF